MSESRFPPEARVRTSADYRKVRAVRRSVRDEVLDLAWARRESGPTRLGTIVPVRGLGAVKRNRVKRVLREVFRAARSGLPAGFDFVVSPRDRTRAADFAEVTASFSALVARMKERERITR